MSRVEAMVREHDTRVWRIVEHHVRTARAQQDFSDVRRVGMDETSARKGQDYISLFADLDAGRVLFATEGGQPPVTGAAQQIDVPGREGSHHDPARSRPHGPSPRLPRLFWA